MARTGRPRVQIDQELFEKLCAMQCTEEEICSLVGCCADTLNAWCKRTYKVKGKGLTFSETYKRFSAKGKVSLRRMQMKLAERSANMAIFLGKVYLGQTEHQNNETLQNKNNLLEAITEAEEIDTDDLPEVE